MPIERKPIHRRRSVTHNLGKQDITKAILQINPIKMKLHTINPQVFAPVLAANASINTLNVAPIDDKVYVYEKKRYGRPQFRFKPDVSEEKIPGQQAIRFSEADNGDLHLDIIIEAFRKEKNVIPLDFKEINITFHYEHNGSSKATSLSVKKIQSVKTLNILKHVYAHTLIKAEDKEAIYKALTSPNLVAKFEIDVKVWWQKPPYTIRRARVGINPKTGKRIQIAEKRVKNKNSKPQSVSIKTELHKLFMTNDEVFQGIFNELDSKSYKWERGSKTVGKIEYSYYFRLTNDPNMVYFLPQVYRIGINSMGQPKVNINLYSIDNGATDKEYRIKMTFHMMPYFHPRARKDLMNKLSSISGQKLKYAQNLQFGGFKDVSFELEDRFSNEDDPISGKFTEKLSKIDPLAGFTITADFSLESFDLFKAELLRDGINIGKMYFDLQEKEEGADIITKSNPITVQLDFRKLENISIESELFTSNNGQGSTISGFRFFNKTKTSIEIEGVELTLLSIDREKNEVYDVDSDLKTNLDIEDWPVTIDSRNEKLLMLDDSKISSLSNKNMVWTDLVCEPYGVRAKVEPEVIMASVIDRAQGDPEVWNLSIVCPLYKRWEQWTDDQRLPYAGIMGLTVNIKLQEGEIFSIKLDRDNPEGIVKMSRSVRQLLQSTNYDNRSYDYQLINETLPPSSPGEWIKSQNTSVNFLEVYPEI
ncbi:hypothetical protein [Psychroserpens algicola]|uniref:Uncharacterized protein n=1 Tax=Psychroserpens algicola TaxID=1719034 RepID=A0ABT0H3Q5_9FLAO|nr:hypothetical protein [Psychroserpens algicola]MCK8479006.1 hypothetical protein [Psychroserpens algicola]